MAIHQLPDLLAIDKSYLEQFRQACSLDKPEGEEQRASLALYTDRAEEDRPYDLVKTVAVIPLRGFLFKRGWWWGCSFDRFADMVRLAVADFAVDTILIDVESPGGYVYGCPDCSDVLHWASTKKRTIAVVNDLCASAALWVASAAKEIVITQSGEMGSIGVYVIRVDYTEALKKDGVGVEIIKAGEQKAWGSPYLPMSDAERKATQAEVDKTYEAFMAAVARNRGVSLDQVRTDWADARMFCGQEAVDIGLADRVASFDEVLAELVGRPVISGECSDGQPTPDARSVRIRRPVGFIRRGG